LPYTDTTASSGATLITVSPDGAKLALRKRKTGHGEFVIRRE
jgi:hypothetical protein